jgi:hypothetical protein
LTLSEFDEVPPGVQVAQALSRTTESAVEAHARDELGINPDELANPVQVPSNPLTTSCNLE